MRFWTGDESLSNEISVTMIYHCINEAWLNLGMLRGVLPGGGPEPGAGADPENSEEKKTNRAKLINI